MKSVTKPMGLLLILCSIWISAGLLLAFATPHFWNADDSIRQWITWGPLLLTGLLLIIVFFAACRCLRQSGNVFTTLPLTLLMFALFGLLFVQVAFHLGTSHYQWENTPDWKSALFFLGMHIFRAGDVADGLEAYGLHTQDLSVQPLYASSLLARGLLIAFHLIVSLFFLSLLLQGWSKITGSLKSTASGAPQKQQHQTPWFEGLFLLAVAAGWGWLAFYSPNPWTSHDRWAWWVDNAIRVVDVTDAAEIFHFRLHNLPQSWELGTLTFLCRLMLLLLLGELIQLPLRSFSIRYLGGLGVSDASLERSARLSSSALQPLAAEQLQQRKQQASQTRTRGLWAGFSVGTLLAAGIMIGGLMRFPQTFQLRPQVLHLAQVVVGEDEQQAVAAEHALSRLGSFADDAVPILSENFAALPQTRRLRIIALLGGMGRNAAPALAKIIDPQQQSPTVETISAARALAGLYAPETIPTLITRWQDPDLELRQAIQQALGNMGPQVIKPLSEELTEENWPEALPIFKTVDDYWYWRESANPVFQDLTRVGKAEQILLDAGFGEEGKESIRNLVQSPYGAAGLQGIEQTFLQGAHDEEVGSPSLGPWVLALVRLDSPDNPILKRLLREGDKQVQQSIKYALLFPEDPTGVIEFLTRLLQSEDPDLRLFSLTILSQYQEQAAPVAPLLVESLKQGGEETELAVKTYRMMGRDAAAPVAAKLIELFPQSEWRFREGILKALRECLDSEEDRERASLVFLPWLHASVPEQRRELVETFYSSIGFNGKEKLIDLIKGTPFTPPNDVLREIPRLSQEETQVLAVSALRLILWYSHPDSLDVFLQDDELINHPSEAVRQVVLVSMNDMRIDPQEVIGLEPEKQQGARLYKQYQREQSQELKEQYAWVLLKHWPYDEALAQEIEYFRRRSPGFTPHEPPAFRGKVHRGMGILGQ